MRWRSVGALLLGLALAPAAEGRRLAVAVRADVPGIRSQVAGELQSHWPGLAPGTLYKDGKVLVFVTEELSAADAADLFIEAALLESNIPGVLGAGESYAVPTGQARIYSGFVGVQLSQPSDVALVTAWAQARGLTVEPTQTNRPHMRLRVPLDSAGVLGVVTGLPPPAGPAKPVFFEFQKLRPLTDSEIGGYHRLPARRNELAVVLQPGVDRGSHIRFLHAASIVSTHDRDTDDDVEFVTFTDEQEMLEEMHVLQGHPDIVLLAGPVISQDPPRFITADLLVDFLDAAARFTARPIMGYYDLVEVSEIPYLDHGYIFRRVVAGKNEPSYLLYDAAAELLDARLAGFAVPNLINENVSLCEGLSCIPGCNQKYFEQIRAGGAWDIAAGSARESVIGILDDGFTDGPPQCDELNVVAILDSKFCDGTTCSLLNNPLCIPEVPTDWCATNCTAPRLMYNSPHSRAMALIAAGIHDPTAREACDTIRGLADGSKLIDVGQHHLSSSWEIASAAWWIAGGDPLDTDHYPTGRPIEPATVLNMSFSRDFPVFDCPNDVPTPLCAKICIGGDPCTLIEHALQRMRKGGGEIREGGILVVAAVPHLGGSSDLHSSKHTTAVATVQYDGTAEPFDSSNPPNRYVDPCPFNPLDPCHTDPDVRCPCAIDLVAPMGGDENPIHLFDQLDTGHTSAATAVVSGVAALMFDVNPDLTATQADCILKATAQKLPDLWTATKLNQWNCVFNDGRSPCFGYGMVDACAAVEAAKACSPCTVQALILDNPKGQVVNVVDAPCPQKSRTFTCSRTSEFPGRPSEFPGRPSEFPGKPPFTSITDRISNPACPCDREGNEIPAEYEITEAVGTNCLNCGGQSANGRSAEMALEKVGALLRCISDEICACDPEEPNCVYLDAINPNAVDYEDIQMEFCRASDCRSIPSTGDTWPKGEKIRLIIPLDEDFIEFWGDIGDPKLELRAYSKEKRIKLD